jgi:hypothetical protein
MDDLDGDTAIGRVGVVDSGRGVGHRCCSDISNVDSDFEMSARDGSVETGLAALVDVFASSVVRSGECSPSILFGGIFSISNMTSSSMPMPAMKLTQASAPNAKR